MTTIKNFIKIKQAERYIKNYVDMAFSIGELEILTEFLTLEHLMLLDSYYCATKYIKNKVENRKFLIGCYRQLIKEITNEYTYHLKSTTSLRLFYLNAMSGNSRKAKERGEWRKQENRVSTNHEYIKSKLEELKLEAIQEQIEIAESLSELNEIQSSPWIQEWKTETKFKYENNAA